MMQRKTIGVDPKVPAQAVTTIVAFVLGYFGIDLDPVLAGAIATVLGVVIGALAPAPKTKLVPQGRESLKSEVGQYDPVYLLVLVVLIIVVVWALTRIL